MVEPDPRPLSSAEELLDEHLLRLERGEPSDVDAIGAARPEVAAELRRLAQANELVSRLLPGPLVPDSGDANGRCQELLDKLRAGRPRDARYRALEEIARGGMGVVVRVHDDELRRDLAMKISRRGESDDELVGRFLNEAQVTSQLDHPGIVPVHEIGVRADGSVYYTMRLVDGVSLRVVFERVRAGTDGWNPVRALGVLLKVCEAMSYAHSKGVLHRDLKPANVMVGKFGEVYVMDWGLARVGGREDRDDLRPRPPDGTVDEPDSAVVTLDGDVLGTPAYMSPEQGRGEVDRLGPRADVYSVGAMLYELLAGRMPYATGDARVPSNVILQRLIEGPPSPLNDVARAAPAELVAICEKAMSRSADERYADMQALADDLRAYVEGRVVRAYETGTWAETRKWVRRNRPLASALAATILVLVAGGIALGELVQARARSRDAERSQAAQRTLQALERFRDRGGITAVDSSMARGWIGRARELVRGGGDDGDGRMAGLEECRALLAEVRERGEPVAEHEATAAAHVHPRFRELEAKRTELQWRARMLKPETFPREEEFAATVRSIVDWAASDAGLATIPATANENERNEGPFTVLNIRIFRMVRPDEWRSAGEETLALALAHHLVDSTQNTPHWRARYLDTLAFALFRVGQFDAATAKEAEAVADLDPIIKSDIRGNVGVLRAAIDGWLDASDKQRIQGILDADVRRLEREIGRSGSRRFGSYDGWLEGELARLEDELVELEGRADRAETVLESEEARRAWSDAKSGIQADSRFGGLVVSPQIDLLPIGPDPESKLWEFAHLPSGDRARRGADGHLSLGPESGIVLVLLPGEPGRIEPFFLSKFELTRQQWARLAGEWPFEFIDQQLRKPMVYVDWDECTKLLHRADGWLELPTEPQWEYAARGGKQWRWWTGDTIGSLRGAEYLSFPPQEPVPETADAREVGQLCANPFGFFDILGNVSEYCRDATEDRDPMSPASGRRDPPWIKNHVTRGGHYFLDANGASPDGRFEAKSGRAGGNDHVGLRPARRLSP